ncbi:MAG: DUF4251 domain-containing protein [Bacteroidetes bacterium]|nr:DUF4251 domain-containing protein [Bacteroidota bacterium]
MKPTAKLILVSMLSMLFMFSNAQEDIKMTTKNQRKAEKEIKKKEKEEKEAADWLVYQKLAQDRQFVAQIEKINAVPVSRRLNFLLVDGERAVIQFETHTYLSENGLGGRTIDGTIVNYKYTPPKNDKSSIFINYDVSSKFMSGIINVSITVTKSGSSTISIGSASFIYGHFWPIEDSNINIGVDMRN